LTETTQETTTIEQTVWIAASPETVWTFWTEPQRLAQWWGSEAEAVAEPDGLFRVVMENGPVMRGSFIELDPPHRLVFSFGWENNAPGELLAPGSTRVEVTLTAEDGGTVLILRHSEMPKSHASDHEKGWSLFVGDRLVAVAATA
jgi:uncharacterized protein YndB with AHSA1/START domain